MEIETEPCHERVSEDRIGKRVDLPDDFLSVNRPLELPAKPESGFVGFRLLTG